MQKYRDNVTIQGRGGLVPVRNANVTVYNNGTNDKAVIYTNAQKTPQANPFITDALGGISFYAENGRYDLLIQGDGQSTRLNDILMQDVLQDVEGLEIDMVAVQGVAASAQTGVERINNDTDSNLGAAEVGYKSSMPNTVSRRQSDENNDRASVRRWTGDQIDGVSVNQVGIQNAVDYCLSTGRSLYWPPGEYVSDGNISNFHLVDHEGDGVILRGSERFYITPRGNDTNTIFISPSGSASNDGLSPSEPMANISNGANALKNNPKALLDGKWRLFFGAGTYSTGYLINDMPVTKNEIVIEGERSGTTPLAIFDGTSSTRKEGMNFERGGGRLSFKYLKFVNWRASSAGGVGIQCRFGFECDLIDCEFDNCDQCVFFFGTRLRLFGGRYENSDYGVRASYQSDFTTYNSIYTANKPYFSNILVSAFGAERGTMGHLDYVDIRDCAYGLTLGETSRVHVMASEFRRCSEAAVWCRGSSQWLDHPDGPLMNNYFMGTADACARIALHEGGSRETRVHGQNRGEVAYRQMTFTDFFSVSGTTTETQLVSTNTGVSTGVCGRVPPWYFSDDRKKITARLSGSLGAAGTKTLNVYFRGILIGTLSTSGSGAFQAEWEIHADSPAIQRVWGKLLVNGQPAAVFLTSGSYSDTTNELQVNFKVKLSDPSGVIIVRRCETFITG